MTAKILRLGREVQTTPLGLHLTGQHPQGPTPGGIIGRMQGETAVRSHVRNMSRSHPLSDSGGRQDIWQQVEDIAALIPRLPSSVTELDDLSHALREVISHRKSVHMAVRSIKLAACRIEIAAAHDVLRLRILGESEGRVITVKLHRHGARRMDDRPVPL